jgi:small subunit ribosomal protein S6
MLKGYDKQVVFLWRVNVVTLYETLFVVHPEKGPRMKEFIEKFEKIIQVQGGSVSPVEEWGLRDLAYRIQKQAKGYYTLLRYQSSGRAVEELERNLKLTDGIIRYLTVRVEEEGQSEPPPASKARSEEPVEPSTERSTKSESQV